VVLVLPTPQIVVFDSRTTNSGVGASSITNSGVGAFSSAVAGVMASFVDTVAQAVQSAKGSPKAEYRNGKVNVRMPIDLRASGMQKLLEMGFYDRAVNERLLIKHNNDVTRCVVDLIAIGDNQWHQTRH